MNRPVITVRRKNGKTVRLEYSPGFRQVRVRNAVNGEVAATINIEPGAQIWEGSHLRLGRTRFYIDLQLTTQQDVRTFVDAVRSRPEASTQRSPSPPTPPRPFVPAPAGSNTATTAAATSVTGGVSTASALRHGASQPQPFRRAEPPPVTISTPQVWGAACAAAVVIAAFLPWYELSGIFNVRASLTGTDISGLWGGWATGIAAAIGGVALLLDRDSGSALGGLAAGGCAIVALRNLLQYRDVVRDYLVGTGVDVNAAIGLYLTLGGAIGLGIAVLVLNQQR
jgi:hypothetical protein